METKSKAAEFEAEALVRLARIKSDGKTLKFDFLKNLVRGKTNRTEPIRSR